MNAPPLRVSTTGRWLFRYGCGMGGIGGIGGISGIGGGYGTGRGCRTVVVCGTAGTAGTSGTGGGGTVGTGDRGGGYGSALARPPPSPIAAAPNARDKRAVGE